MLISLMRAHESRILKLIGHFQAEVFLSQILLFLPPPSADVVSKDWDMGRYSGNVEQSVG